MGPGPQFPLSGPQGPHILKSGQGASGIRWQEGGLWRVTCLVSVPALPLPCCDSGQVAYPLQASTLHHGKRQQCEGELIFALQG